MRTFLVVLLALLVLGLPLALPFAAAKVEAPTPTIGDFWEMHSSSSIPDGGGNATSVTRDTIAAFESVTIEGQTYEAVRTEIFSNTTTTGGAMDTTSSSHTTSWTRRSDGAALKTTNRFSYSTLPGLPATEVTSETVYLQPCRHLPFPIDVGDEWEIDCATRTTTSSAFPGQPDSETTTNETYTIRALREERITVPAGTFDTILLEWTSTAEGGSFTWYQWYSPVACTYVRSANDLAGTDVTGELASHRCASPAPTRPPARRP